MEVTERYPLLHDSDEQKVYDRQRNIRTNILTWKILV